VDTEDALAAWDALGSWEFDKPALLIALVQSVGSFVN